MPKKELKEEKDQYTVMTETVSKFVDNEYIPWREELKKYWPQIDKNQDMWEFYKSEREKSPSKVSLNTPFAIIESMVARANESKMIIGAEAYGINGLKEVEEYVASTTKGAIEDRDIEALHGSFRKRKEMHFRSYLVKGNAVSEDQYEYKTLIVEGDKKVVADNPYTDTLSYKSVIFNPVNYMDSSPVYWVEKSTTYEKLKEQEYDAKTGRGIYNNLAVLKDLCQKNGKFVDHEDEKVIQNGKKVARKIEPIELLFRWKGCHLTVIANRNTIIRQITDPFKTGRHNLHISMNYKVEGRPYAYGEMDPIYKLARAQDTSVNQNITAINKYLDPAMTYDPDDRSINIDQIMDVLENGGIAPGKKDSVNLLQRQLPPNQAFQTVDGLQQAIERTARYTGVASQSTDMTKGTATTLQEVNRSAAPDFQTKLDDLRDTYYQPIASCYLAMIANLMSETDVRFSKLKGKTEMWVKATKNLLMGKLNAEELLNSGVIKEEDFKAFITDENGQEYPELAKESLYDVDWLITVTLDNQADSDKMQKTERKKAWFAEGVQYGLPMDVKKFHSNIGQESDIDDPEQYYLPEEQVQAQKAQQAQEQQAQAEQQNQEAMAKEHMKHGMNMEAKQVELQAKQGMSREQQQAQMEMARMKSQPQPMM